MNRLGAAGVALLVLGVALFGGGIYLTFQQESGLSDLRETTGTVVSASLEPAEEDGFHPNVTYRYSVDGTDYTSNRIFPGGDRRPMPREDAVEVLGRYRAGQEVTVYLLERDPTNPSLRAPRSPVPVFAAGFGFVALSFGFLLFVAGRQGGMDPIETDEVTLPDTEPTPKGDTDGGDPGSDGNPDGSGTDEDGTTDDGDGTKPGEDGDQAKSNGDEE